MKRIHVIFIILMTMMLTGCAPEMYTVTFNTNGGELVESIEVVEETSVNEPIQPYREGYTFLGWYSDSTLNSVYNFTSPVVGNITLHADWDINQYTISFNELGGSEVVSIYGDFGTSINAPVPPTMEGYTFDKWYTEPSLLNEFEFTTIPGEDTVLYAGWIANEHTITYEDWNGDVLYNGTFEYGFDLSDLSISDPSRVGYTFQGWDLNKPDFMPNQDLTFEAEYSINRYSISFNSNGGSTVQTITQDYGTRVYAPEIPIKEGYSFLGWYKDENLTEIYVFNNFLEESDTLYAKWDINEYTLSYVDWDGTVLYQNVFEYGEDISQVTVDSPTRIGHTFYLWNDILPNEMPAQNLLFEAVYLVNQYSISFVSYGGSSIPVLTQDYGTPVVAPTPDRIGYTFDGWYTNEELSETYVFTTIIDEDIVLYAKWNINSYSLMYQDEDGTTLKTAVYEYNSDLSDFVIPDDPHKAGYAFTGWNIELPDNMPAYNLVITAQYPFAITVLNEEIIITEYVGSSISVVIPNILEGYPVVSIGNNAFDDCDLVSIVLPVSLRTIGNQAFIDNNLTELVLPEGVTSIGDYSFRSNALTSVTIPSTLTSIGTDAFRYNRGAMTLTISEGIQSISALAFQDANIVDIVFPTTLLTIGNQAFMDNELTELVLPEGLISIGNYSFRGNALTSVTIPSTLTTIGTEAFRFNRAAMTLTISEGVTSIGALAFYDANIVDIVFPTTLFTIGNQAFMDNELTELILPEGVISIGNFSFRENALTSVTIPSTLTTIGTDAFRFNRAGMTLTISEGIQSISALAFYDANVVDIVFPTTLTTIGNQAFMDNNLTELILPEGLTSIGDYSFRENALTSVTIPSTLTTIGTDAFRYNRAGMTLTISEGVTSISSFSFRDANIIAVVLPSTLETIGTYAFEDNNLIEVEIPESVTIIGNYAFSNNSFSSVFILGESTRFNTVWIIIGFPVELMPSEPTS